MNLPSRGLRLSATTMRNTGVFFAPIRFMRILTAINHYSLDEGGFQSPWHPASFSDADSKRGVSLFMLLGVGKPCFRRISNLQPPPVPCEQSAADSKSAIRQIKNIGLLSARSRTRRQATDH